MFLGILKFLKSFRVPEAKARSNYVKTEEVTCHIFQTRNGDELSTRPVAQDDCERTPAPAPERGGRLMGFIGRSSALEFDAQTDLPDPGPIDEIDYDLDIEPAAEESESESSFEDDAPDQPDDPGEQHVRPLRVLLPRASSTRVPQPRQLRKPTITTTL